MVWSTSTRAFAAFTEGRPASLGPSYSSGEQPVKVTAASATAKHALSIELLLYIFFNIVFISRNSLWLFLVVKLNNYAEQVRPVQHQFRPVE